MPTREEKIRAKIAKLKQMLNLTNFGFNEESIEFSEHVINYQEGPFVKISFFANKSKTKKSLNSFMDNLMNKCEELGLSHAGKYTKKTSASLKVQLPKIVDWELEKFLKEMESSQNQVETVSADSVNADFIKFFELHKFYAFPSFSGEQTPGISEGIIECFDSAEANRLTKILAEIGVTINETADEAITLYCPVVPLDVDTPRIRIFKDINDVIKRFLWLVDKRLKLQPKNPGDIKESDGYVGETSLIRFKNEAELILVKRLLRVYGFEIKKEGREGPETFRLGFSLQTNPVEIKPVPEKKSAAPSLESDIVWAILRGQGFCSKPSKNAQPMKKYASYFRATQTVQLLGEAFTDDDMNAQRKDLEKVFGHHGYMTVYPKATTRTVRKSFKLSVPGSTGAATANPHQVKEKELAPVAPVVKGKHSSLLGMFSDEMWKVILEEAPVEVVANAFRSAFPEIISASKNLVEEMNEKYFLIAKDHPIIQALLQMSSGDVMKIEDVLLSKMKTVST